MQFNRDMTDQGLVSVMQVAHLAGLTDTAVRNWIASNDIPTNETSRGKMVPAFWVALELGATGLPLISLKEATAQVGGDLNQTYRLNALERVARLRLPNGRDYYTTFGVAKSLGIRNPVYLTTTEAAKLLGITRDRVARRIHDGSLSGIRQLGGFRWFAEAASVTPIPETEGWCRVAEVAAAWQMNPTSVNRMCKRGKLKSVLIGGTHGTYLIDPECVADAPKQPITTGELIRLTSLPKSTVEFWRRTGKIKGKRLGYNWRYPRSEATRIKRMLARNQRART